MKPLYALVALIALAGCGATSSPGDTAPSASPGIVTQPAVAVKTQRLRRESLRGTIDVNGSVVADAGGQAALAFPTDGQIATVNVNVGDRVARGEVLASLDSRTASSAIVQADADVAAAQASLTKAEARARPQEFAQNTASVDAARAKLRSAQAELDRQRALAHVGISSLRDLQQADADYQSALADARIAEQQGSILQAGPRPQDVAIASAAVQQAQAARAAAGTRASLLNIVAPFDGVITQRLKNPGESADPTTPVLAMVNPAHTAIEVQISQDQAVLVRTGAPAMIAIDGSVARIPATVVAVSPALGVQTGTMTVRIRPEHGAFTIGAAAKASIVVSELAAAFVVPETAVVKDPETGETVVYIAKGGGRYARVPVQIRLQTAKRVAIAGSGLALGQQIVTQGAYELLPFAGGASGD